MALFRTIRFRLTLWFAIALAVVLTASGFYWQYSLSQNLLGHIDHRLQEVAQETGRVHLGHQQSLDLPRQCDALEAFLREQNWNEYVQVLDSQGAVECVSSNLKGFRLPLSKQALQAAAKGLDFTESERSLGSHPLRIYTYPVLEDGKLTHLLQVGVSLASVAETLKQLWGAFFAFGPLVLLLLGAGGWLLVGWALSPVSRMTRAVRKINAESLSQRLPLGHGQDEISQLAETFNDMLARLEDSFRKIKQFSGDASHELRTPLTIIRGETEVALRWAKDPEEMRSALQSNLEEIDRMGRIIDDLLTLAKSEAGEMPLEMKEFSLSDLVQQLYLQGRLLGEAKQMDVSLQLDVAEEIRIRGDELRLRQMFLNLITNAIKYTPDQGKVVISMAVDEGRAVVTVRDSGIGIPAEHLPHIFSRFYRIDKARNREDGGTGLGLAIVKWIVEVHDGKIRVTSNPDQGSIFTVYLPIEGPQKTLDPKPSAAADS
ncbi:MAG: HAMP domain-containing sensor histidine kinase [Trichloromonadaceae bacterium]